MLCPDVVRALCVRVTWGHYFFEFSLNQFHASLGNIPCLSFGSIFTTMWVVGTFVSFAQLTKSAEISEAESLLVPMM